jgi:hypothetical protein
MITDLARLSPANGARDVTLMQSEDMARHLGAYGGVRSYPAL